MKVGFNSGEVQTWKTIEFDQIGKHVMGAVLDGMLLNLEANQELDSYLSDPE